MVKKLGKMGNLGKIAKEKPDESSPG